MRPNYAQDEPPTAITVGGRSYPCETDWKAWIQVLDRLRKLDVAPSTESGRTRLLEGILEIENQVFGGALVQENPLAVLQAVAEFSRGYPQLPGRSRQTEPVYSFDYDLNDIVVAIWDQHHVDLSYRRKEPFHWWEFLLLFRTLAGEHVITNLMQIRGYAGKDKELRRKKRENALPVEYTDAEKAEYEEFSALFDSGDE